MTNPDGHDDFDTEVVWEIPDEPREWARLADHLAPMGADAMEWLAKHDGKTISRGRVTRDRRHWTLWANSLERLASFESFLRELVPDARQISRKAERRGGPPHRRARHIMVESYLFLTGRDHGGRRAHARRVLGRSGGGIFGMTPRAAAASGYPGLRRKLETELDDMECATTARPTVAAPRWWTWPGSTANSASRDRPDVTPVEPATCRRP